MNEKNVKEIGDNEDYYKQYSGLWGETLSQQKNRLVYSRRCKNMMCIYCGENAQTREHCPPRCFFPEHNFPDNLRVLPACENCNKGFSHDEEIVRDYLNCAYEFFCHKVSEMDYSAVTNGYVELTEQNKWPIKEAERIFAKVARGLAIYEMSECFGDCGWISKVTDYICKHWVTQKEWNALYKPIDIDVFPELGTRASDENYLIQFESGSIDVCSIIWTELQKDVFSYIVWMQDDDIMVRMILRNFFYVEVKFSKEDLVY